MPKHLLLLPTAWPASNLQYLHKKLKYPYFLSTNEYKIVHCIIQLSRNSHQSGSQKSFRAWSWAIFSWKSTCAPAGDVPFHRLSPVLATGRFVGLVLAEILRRTFGWRAGGQGAPLREAAQEVGRGSLLPCRNLVRPGSKLKFVCYH